jgi:hypothetical protein
MLRCLLCAPRTLREKGWQANGVCGLEGDSMMDFLQLTGKSILIFGVANRKSVAWHISRVLSEARARSSSWWKLEPAGHDARYSNVLVQFLPPQRVAV